MPGSQTEPFADFPRIPGVEIEREIASGSYAVVYRGRQLDPPRPLAIKVLLHRSGADDERSFARFEREGTLLSTLKHPGIVEYYGSGTTDRGRAYLLMELADGPNLRDHVEQTGRMTVQQVLDIGKTVAEALRHAHQQGIMHRDVKAENILLHRVEGSAPDEFAFLPKLADLGLARPDNDSDVSNGITMRGAIVGTPSIMAPEQFQEAGEVDYRVDIYALGCVMFFALTGENPFGRGSLPEMAFRKVRLPAPQARTLVADVPASLSDFLARMMNADRAVRPQTYDELIAFFSGRNEEAPASVVKEPAITPVVEQAPEVELAQPEAAAVVKERGGVGCLVPFALALSGGAGCVWAYL